MPSGISSYSRRTMPSPWQILGLRLSWFRVGSLAPLCPAWPSVLSACLRRASRPRSPLPQPSLCRGPPGLPCLRFPLLLVLRVPLQISVLDPVAALTYKRQVVLVHLAPGITYRPSVEDATVIDTVDFVELVVESFEALATDFAGILAKSAADLRVLLEAPHQSSVVQSVYALRVLHGSVHNLGRVVQFPVKLPLTHRLAFLRLSGTGPFFVRDFLAQGADPQDHSVVHRFWPLSVEGLRACLPGPGGVCCVLHSHIADARRGCSQSCGCTLHPPTVFPAQWHSCLGLGFCSGPCSHGFHPPVCWAPV